MNGKNPDIVPYDDRCWSCRKREATKLCDFIKGTIWNSKDLITRQDTCDQPICDRCAVNLADEFDFCPECAERARIKLGVKK
jgi:hypothetical protein